jgi:hypothetical protein
MSDNTRTQESVDDLLLDMASAQATVIATAAADVIVRLCEVPHKGVDIRLLSIASIRMAAVILSTVVDDDEEGAVLVVSMFASELRQAIANGKNKKKRASEGKA